MFNDGESVSRKIIKPISLEEEFMYWILIFTKWFQNCNQKNFVKHQSSSIEDLKILFEAEKSAINFLSQTKAKMDDNDNSTLSQAIDGYLKVVDYDL